MSNPKILITGGSGFLGINLVRYLCERGYALASLDIAPFDYPDVRPHVQAFLGDIREPQAVDKAMEGATQVIHTAAALPLYTPEEIRSTDVDGTRILLESASRHGIERFIHISSTAVYGVPDHHPIYETDRLEGVGPYGQAKIDAEAACLEYRAEGMVMPILRPKSFVGPERLGVFDLLYDWALEGRNFPMIGSGNNRYQLLDVEDLCQAIHLCMTLPKEAVNDTFNIGAKVYTTMKEDYQAVLDAAGFGKRIIPFPAGPAIFGLRILEKMKLSPLYKWVYDTAGKESFVSIEKAERQIGYKPKHSNKQALLRNFQWYKENQAVIRQATGITHRVPWKQGALGLVKHLF